ncbi:endolytic transglycosylase MltG [Candidatus Saccharibacteria bacterium]|nr:endolytic transglycosylase MltG [Candidatus Saccharibacteria bacterium]
MKFIALDVGEKRIGLSKADSGVKIAVPVGMIAVDGQEIANIVKYIKLNDIDVVVVGMPRNLNGEMTAQSDFVKRFVKSLNKTLLSEKPNNKTIKILFQDESLTSVEAKKNLKNKGFNKKAGDVDSEAATLILQDFLENLERRVKEKKETLEPAPPAIKVPKNASRYSQNPLKAPNGAPVSPRPDFSEESKNAPKTQFKPYKKNSAKKWVVIRVLIIVALIGFCAVLGANAWYNASISPKIASKDCASIFASDESDPCHTIEVKIPDGSTVTSIAAALKDAGIIRSSLSFRIYATLNKVSSDLKAGTYHLSPSESVEKIVEKLRAGTNDAIVFRFTALPGETMKDIKKRLMSIGYEEAEIDAAFSKKYDHPVLASKPADASLEGYLFGETYEFYTTDSVETIVIRMLDELYTVVQKNNLNQKFNNLGLTLHEGIVLASVVQKEAGTTTKEDMANVAGVFYNRLNNGMTLGSDVTAKYAADLVDPERKTYTDNAAVLQIDSCYNTRLYAGLPCGAISNPSALVLIATANPSDSSYLYFLTGDDGMMYYGNTESEHLQNRDRYCQELCNVSL